MNIKLIDKLHKLTFPDGRFKHTETKALNVLSIRLITLEAIGDNKLTWDLIQDEITKLQIEYESGKNDN